MKLKTRFLILIAYCLLITLLRADPPASTKLPPAVTGNSFTVGAYTITLTASGTLPSTLLSGSISYSGTSAYSSISGTAGYATAAPWSGIVSPPNFGLSGTVTNNGFTITMTGTGLSMTGAFSGTIQPTQISGALTVGQLPIGTGSNQVATGNDSRFGVANFSGTGGIIVVTSTNSAAITASGTGTNAQLIAANGRPFMTNSFAKTGIVATRGYSGGWMQATTTSQTSTSGTTTYRLKHYITNNCSNLRVEFGNSEQETAGFNNITVQASIEDSSGNIYPAYFQGQLTVTITPGTFVTSDPIGVNFAAGAQIWSRTCVVQTGTYNLGAIYQLTGEGTSGSNQVLSGTTWTGSLGYTYVPFEILGDVSPDAMQVALVGDSIFSSLNGNSPWDDPPGVHALGANFGQNYAHVNVAQNAESLATFAAPQGRKFRTQLLKGCTHAIVEYALVHIDTASLSTAQAQLVAFWTQLNQMGMKVYMCTITPNTTSTDSFATTTNQTPVNATTEAIRVQLNDWIRTTPAPLNGYFETADQLESARDSGLWKAPSYTTDGLHPATSAINNIMAAGITPSVFSP